MARALDEWFYSSQYDALAFEDRFGLLVDRETKERDNHRLQIRLRKAKLRITATVEDIDQRHPRGLDKTVLLTLAGCRWIHEHQNCLISGPTDAGKSYIACALAHKACREGFGVLSLRVPRMLHELASARADGCYPRLLNSYARTNLFVLDDW